MNRAQITRVLRLIRNADCSPGQRIAAGAYAVSKAAENASMKDLDIHSPTNKAILARIGTAALSARQAMLAHGRGDLEAWNRHSAAAKADHDYLAEAFDRAGKTELAQMHRDAGTLHSKGLPETQATSAVPETSAQAPPAPTVKSAPPTVLPSSPAKRGPGRPVGPKNAPWKELAHMASELSKDAVLATLRSGRGKNPTEAIWAAGRALGARDAKAARQYHLMAKQRFEVLAAHHRSLPGEEHAEAAYTNYRAAQAHGAAALLAHPAHNREGITYVLNRLADRLQRRVAV